MTTWLDNVIDTYRQGGTKAISHRPDLAGRVHIISGKPEDEIGPDVLDDYTSYAEAHARHVWLRRGIQVLSSEFSPLPIRVVDDNGDGIDAHPLTGLYAFGNDEHGPAQNNAAWVAHMILGGEAFEEIVSDERGRPTQLWMRRPDEMAVLPDATRPLYPRANGYRWVPSELDFDAADMVHWMFNNPLNVWRGLSVVGAIRASITIDIFAQSWSKNLLRDGGNPDVAILAPQGITKPERERWENIYIEKFRGWENWHKRPIILEDGITDIKPLSWPPSDMEWLEQRKVARDEIGAMLGVPDILMGFGADSYDTEEKRKTAIRTLWALTIIPLVEFRDIQLNTFWTKRRPGLLKPGETIKTDLSGVDILQIDIGPKVETAGELWAMGVPFNVIDERLGLGIGPVSGGDVGYLPFSVQEVGLAQIEPASETLATSEMVAKALIRKAPAFDSIEHRAWMKQRDASLLPFENRMARILKRFIQNQQLEVGRRLREMTTRKQDAPPTLPPVTELFDVEEEAAAFKEAMRPVVIAMFAASGQAALDLVLGGEAPVFGVTDPLVLQAIEFVLEQHSLKTQNTTFLGLTELFKTAELEGASIPRIMEMLSDYFGGRKSPAQTERTARTTIGAAHSVASRLANESSGVVMGYEWMTTLDGRERLTHANAHGQFVPSGVPYEVGGALLRFPRDPAGPPQEVISCRCDEFPVTESAAAIA